MVSLDGTLTYRTRSDGSPYSAINHASGTYTELPDAGDKVDCGDVLYRVDDDPVLLLCGTVPAYRDLAIGDEGKDVRQLNRNLHELGYDADAGVDTLEVHVDLEASQQGVVKEGDLAQITLPGNESVKGKVDRLGRAAQTNRCDALPAMPEQ